MFKGCASVNMAIKQNEMNKAGFNNRIIYYLGQCYIILNECHRCLMKNYLCIRGNNNKNETPIYNVLLKGKCMYIKVFHEAIGTNLHE